MDFDHFVGIAEIAAALGVVATLGYLAYQIGQTNRIAKAAVVGELMDKYIEFLTVLLANPEVSDLASKLTDPDFVPAPGEETHRVENFANLVCSIWFTTQVSYDQGQVDEREYAIYSSDVVARLNQWPAARPYFKRVTERYPELRDFPMFAPIFESGD
jgi:hypothetical protein